MVLKNGKNKIIGVLAAWLFTIVVIIAIPALANNMVKNDRIRAEEDQRMEDKFDKRIEYVDKKVCDKLDKLLDVQIEQGKKLVRIESKLN